jgi:hypothetical protein
VSNFNMTQKKWRARCEVFEEAADHLLLNWTDDKEEEEQAAIVSKFLKAKAQECWSQGELCKLYDDVEGGSK